MTTTKRLRLPCTDCGFADTFYIPNKGIYLCQSCFRIDLSYESDCYEGTPKIGSWMLLSSGALAATGDYE